MYARAGEPAAPSFRSDRLYEVNGKWYFVTREKTREGPYQTRSAAGIGIEQYITRVRAPTR